MLVARGIDYCVANGVKQRDILHQIDFSVRPGEVVGLIGPNGAGKSTLLRLLAGLLAPESGGVSVGDYSLTSLNANERAQRIAFLAQGAQVHWPLAVEHVVGLGRIPHRKGLQDFSEADQNSVNKAIHATKIGDLLTRSIGSLSSGERMRVLLARLLAVEADYILADEPVTALDPFFQLEFMSLFRQQAGEGKGVVLVLHDLALAARYCDRVVILARGSIIADGSPAEVLTEENIKNVFNINILRGNVDDMLYVLPWQHDVK